MSWQGSANDCSKGVHPACTSIRSTRPRRLRRYSTASSCPMPRRLFVDAPLDADTDLTLDPERSHYLCRVLRQRRGDHAIVFCGDGNGYDAHITAADPRACEIHVGAIAEREPAPRLRLHLAQALIKGE